MTLERNWIAAKVQFHACRVVQFWAGPPGDRWIGTSHCAPSWRPSCAPPSAAAGWHPTNGCPRAGPSPIDLDLSRGLVQECYEQLRSEGYLTSRAGSATRVAALSGRAHVLLRCRSADPAGGSGASADCRLRVRRARPGPRPRARTGRGRSARPAGTLPNAAFHYGDPRASPDARGAGGLPGPRARGRRARRPDPRLLRLRPGARDHAPRAGPPRPDQGRLRGPGVDRHGHCSGHVRGVARWCRCRVDEHGIDVEALSASGARVAWSPRRTSGRPAWCSARERRHQLLAWARERDGIIVEDDYDAEFRYDRDPVGSMQGLAPDRVVALGTVSKSLAPALRLGWTVVPAAFAEDVAAEKQVADRGTSGIDQAALAILIESGRYDRHLRRMRAEYSGRRGVLVAALESTCAARATDRPGRRLPRRRTPAGGRRRAPGGRAGAPSEVCDCGG